MLPASRVGKMSMFASPCISPSGAFFVATSLFSAASAWYSPLIFQFLLFSSQCFLSAFVACVTTSWSGWAALPAVLKLSIAMRGSTPICSAACAVLMAIWLSSSLVGCTLSAQSLKRYSPLGVFMMK